MTFFIKKNSTLPYLSVELFVDGGTQYRNITDNFSSSTITFSMMDEESGIFKILDKPVSVVENYTTGDGLKSYRLKYQFTKKETSKIGNFIGIFKIKNSNGVYQLPIINEVKISVLESFSDSDFCCRPNRGGDIVIFPSETPRQSFTPTPTPSVSPTPSVTPTITPSTSVSNTTTPTPSVTVTPTLTPFLTPSPTPSITPTISVTPSITPTISVTPSVTKTPNLTPTPSSTQGDKTIYVYYPNL